MTTLAIWVGHGKGTDGKWDPGCTYDGYTEAALMLPVAQSMVENLESSGFDVISDAFRNNNMNMTEQVKEANAKNARLFMSLHCDYREAPSGTLPLYVSDEGKKLADIVNKRVTAHMGIGTRGLVKRTGLYELNATNMTACIFETGSIKADLALLRDKPALYGKILAWGVCDYLGVPFKAADNTSKVDTDELKVDGLWAKDTTKKTQKALGTTIDGIVSSQKISCKKYIPNCMTASWQFVENAKGSEMVRAIQKLVGATVDGIMGKLTVIAMQKFLAAKGLYEGAIDGIMGKLTVMAWQMFINLKLKGQA